MIEILVGLLLIYATVGIALGIIGDDMELGFKVATGFFAIAIIVWIALGLIVRGLSGL